MMENCVEVGSRFVYPKLSYGPYGYQPEQGKFPFEYISALGVLDNPLRRVVVAEKWTPHEVSLFESAIALYGKKFNLIAKYVSLIFFPSRITYPFI